LTAIPRGTSCADGTDVARLSLKLGLIVALISMVLTFATGDRHVKQVKTRSRRSSPRWKGCTDGARRAADPLAPART
jgi:hypothetical protein